MGFKSRKSNRVLSIDLYSRGFAYVVMEGPTRLVDWGIKSNRKGGDRLILEKMLKLIQWSKPEITILEDHHHASSLKRTRMTRIHQLILTGLKHHEIQFLTVTRENILETFEPFGASTKFDIARQIIRLLPELEDHLPPLRKAWMSEDPRINIFDAVALTWAAQSRRVK